MTMTKFCVALCVAIAGFAGLCRGEQHPGHEAKTPIHNKVLDGAVFGCWVDGKESPVASGEDAIWQMERFLWSTTAGHPGDQHFRFGDSKNPGPRHLRVGFKQSVTIGTVIIVGGGQLSYLKKTSTYPGRLDKEEDWLPAQRIRMDGKVTSDAIRNNDCAIWMFPAGTQTRALRFSHIAQPSDSAMFGAIGGALVLSDRFLNVAPFANAIASSNQKDAERVRNLYHNYWGSWANEESRRPSERRVISEMDPEYVTLVWPEPVTLDALIGLHTGFGAFDLEVYTGPANQHPRNAKAQDWKCIKDFSNFHVGYPVLVWPNYFPLDRSVTTRAIRLKITATTREGHEHINGTTNKGRRVWLSQLFALRKLGPNDAIAAPDFATRPPAEINPPIPIPFTLPKAGYVTLVIEDANGIRVRNLIQETWFEAGRNTAWWDGTNDLERDPDAARHGLYTIPATPVAPGTYTVRGLYHEGIRPFYEFSIYNPGTPAWDIPDHTGAWLANHSSPSAAAFVPAERSPIGEPTVFLGAYVTEGPDGLIWVDADGKKRGGRKWIGGTWTAAPYLATDVGDDPDPDVAVYIGAVWEANDKSEMELRLNALSRDNKATRHVLNTTLGRKDNMFRALTAIAAHNRKLAVALKCHNQIWIVDAVSGHTDATVDITSPEGVAFSPSGKLYATTEGELVEVVVEENGVVPLVSAGLDEPSMITVDAKGNIYVANGGQSHQVKVFTPEGKFVRDIGEAGAPKAGPYNERHMNSPMGLAVDNQGRLWVAECDYMPKRISVWDADGKFLTAFYGPGKYGGGGSLDPTDKTKFYYADEHSYGSMEFELDWETGKDRLVNVLYRKQPGFFEFPNFVTAPETVIYHGGKRYFVNCFNSNPTGGSGAFLFVDKGGYLQAVAGMGMANQWWWLIGRQEFRELWPEGTNLNNSPWEDHGRNAVFYIWNDENGDGNIQPDEIRFFKTALTGLTVMDDLCFYGARMWEKAVRFRPRFHPETGLPTYDMDDMDDLVPGVLWAVSSGGDQMLADASNEAIITLGIKPFSIYSICGTRDGKPVWSYPNLWPGLHASHEGPPHEFPGVLVGPTRLLGNFFSPEGSQVAPLWAINGNMGNVYVFTRDGLFVTTLFHDVRQGKAWQMPAAERGMPLDGVTLHDENFWPSITRTSDGKVYLLEGGRMSLVRLDGFETLRPIPPQKVDVTTDLLQKALAYRKQKEALRQQEQGGGALRVTLGHPIAIDGRFDDWSALPSVDIDRRGVRAWHESQTKPFNVTAKMAVSEELLCVFWDTSLPDLLRNSGEMPTAPFKTGGALDVMLGTNPAANPDRREPVAGDVRLIVTMVDGKAWAMLYRAVVQGTATAKRTPFSSPWRTVYFDDVRDVTEHVRFAADGEGRFEIGVPLSLLGLKPKGGMSIKGDVGILRGEGGRTTARTYWSNKATGITADVPSEAELVPALWGTLEFQ